jgi:D-alanyl-D-alanine carboxypeptidase/D-alanyl-D-alanine-endopeptidase (penicillin-binding protein 4)
VNKIQSAGIKKFDGAMRTDGRRYDHRELPREWLLEDVGNYYGARASGLNYRENQYKIILKPGKKVGDPVSLIRTEPAFNFVGRCELTTAAAGSGDNAYIILNDNGYVLQGTIPLGGEAFTIKGSLSWPDVMLGDELEKRLGREGGTPNLLGKDTVVLHTLLSPPLAEVVNMTNLNSINLYAESLLREMGYVYSGGKRGSTENGVKAVLDLLLKDGINSSGLVMKDGCGLARANAIPALFLVDILQKGYSSKAFNKSLPVSGQSGSMKNMGNGTFIEGNMRAKTGHMEGVRSYAGYVKGKDGKMRCFALIVNNYSCSSAEIKQKIEKVLVALGS